MTKTYEVSVIHFLPFCKSNTLLSLCLHLSLTHAHTHTHTDMMYNLTLSPK